MPRPLILSFILSSALAILTNQAFAGFPTDDVLTCPVGGEEFTITSTTSCSSMGRYLSGRPVTSCDYARTLKVCPTNKLPIYKSFTENDLRSVEALMASERWNDLRDLPTYQRAVAMEDALGLLSVDDALWLRLRAMNWQWDELTDPTGFTREFATRLDRVKVAALEDDAAEGTISAESHRFYKIAAAYQLARSGQIDAARQRIRQVRALDELPDSEAENDYLETYRQRVADCINEDMSDENCTPDSTVDIGRN